MSKDYSCDGNVVRTVMSPRHYRHFVNWCAMMPFPSSVQFRSQLRIDGDIEFFFSYGSIIPFKKFGYEESKKSRRSKKQKCCQDDSWRK